MENDEEEIKHLDLVDIDEKAVCIYQECGNSMENDEEEIKHLDLVDIDEKVNQTSIFINYQNF
jgi:hypothetical protein